MEKGLEYRRIVKKLLEEYSSELNRTPDPIETFVIADEEKGHYLLYNSGWQNERRTYGCSLHINVRGEKVYIQRNHTELEIASELAEKGIPKEAIVLEFQAPSKRAYSGFAVA